MDLPEHLSNYSPQIDQLRQVAALCWQRGWSPAGSCNFSLVVQWQPLRMLTTRGSSCRGKLLAEDFEIVYDEHPSTLADSTAFSRETALHLWLAQHHQAGAIVQTHSIWSLLLADRYGPLEGIMLEGYDLLQRLPNLETKSPVEWLPIVSFYDQTPLIQAIERTMKDSPTELSRPPRAMVLQQQGLLTWAADINEAHRQAELFEYFCEYWVRKASLG